MVIPSTFDDDPASIADEILVNEGIVDNQIRHGLVTCFLKDDEEMDVNMFQPIKMVFKWLEVVFLLIVEKTKSGSQLIRITVARTCDVMSLQF